MKYTLKLEQLVIFLAATFSYFYYFDGSWEYYALLFFAPDLAFLFMLLGREWTVIAYNLLHHQGLAILLIFIGLLASSDITLHIGLIFLAHSAFDRIVGYGLKFADSLDHTHLGWVGKSKDMNKSV